MKSFKHWRFQEVEEAFGLARVKQLERLSNWMKVDTEDIEEEKRQAIEKLRVNLLDYIDYWNEAEIKIYFIGPFILLVDFQKEDYRGFWERPLKVTVGEDSSSGIIDFMLAKGTQIPKAPYFCIQEYKPEPGTANDPIGQLLIAMVAAQEENAKIGFGNLAIYGAYTIGRNWYFVVLDGKQYSISDAYIATRKDIFHVFLMMKKMENYAEVVMSN